MHYLLGSPQSMNSVIRAVDLAALLLAPLASGLLMSYGGTPFAGAVGVALYCAAAYLPEVWHARMPMCVYERVRVWVSVCVGRTVTSAGLRGCSACVGVCAGAAAARRLQRRACALVSGPSLPRMRVAPAAGSLRALPRIVCPRTTLRPCTGP